MADDDEIPGVATAAYVIKKSNRAEPRLGRLLLSLSLILSSIV
jgi:hypothetical protein